MPAPALVSRALRPGGTLAVITAGPDPAHPGAVTAAARAAGFVYAQHIVLLYAAATRLAAWSAGT